MKKILLFLVIELVLCSSYVVYGQDSNPVLIKIDCPTDKYENYTFNYDGNHLSSVDMYWEEECKFLVNTSWKLITSKGSYTYTNITYNSKGYVTGFNFGNDVYSFTYNTDGTLAGIKNKKGVVLLRWFNGNLVRIVRGNRIYNITYSQTDNIYRQMPLSLTKEIFMSAFDALEAIRHLMLSGLFGKGPVNLPICTKNSEPISFQLTPDGKISSEKFGNTLYNYVYAK